MAGRRCHPSARTCWRWRWRGAAASWARYWARWSRAPVPGMRGSCPARGIGIDERQADPAFIAGESQHAGGAAQHRERGRGDAGALVSVRCETGKRRQHEQHGELDEADEAEPGGCGRRVHGQAGDVVGLPGDDHRHAGERQDGEQPDDQQGPKRADLEGVGRLPGQGGTVGLVGLGSGHGSLLGL